jgi:hypothetical protein
MKLTDLDVTRRSLSQEMAQEMITTNRAIAAEEASFAVHAEPGSGASVIAFSATERGILQIRFDVGSAPPTMHIELLPWKSARLSVTHAVEFGRPGAWTVGISRDDGPRIEVKATADDQGWTDFLRAVPAQANP